MPTPPNPTNKFSLKTLFLFSPLIILYIMVLFGFFIRENIPFEDHYLFPNVFLGIFVLFLFLAPAMVRKLKMKRFSAFGFIVVHTLLLYFNSSIKRGYEASNYVEKNEKELLTLVDQFQNRGVDSTLHAKTKEMNITSFALINGNYDFRLYKYLGYGYGLTYTDSVNMGAPNLAPNKSPIIKWIKVKEHWYYYSYFD